mmetsp:Transcript_25704/g.89528  ORF Transcript_25704/g.89528 Transcript_25704/m.89528 type:complete len:300 (-) Transcript_25704:8-907(-)
MCAVLAPVDALLLQRHLDPVQHLLELRVLHLHLAGDPEGGHGAGRDRGAAGAAGTVVVVGRRRGGGAQGAQVVQQVQRAQAGARAPLPRVQEVRAGDGPPLPVDGQLRWLLQLPILLPVPLVHVGGVPLVGDGLAGAVHGHDAPRHEHARSHRAVSPRAIERDLHVRYLRQRRHRHLDAARLARLPRAVGADHDRVLRQPQQEPQDAPPRARLHQQVRPGPHAQLPGDLRPRPVLVLVDAAEPQETRGRRHHVADGALGVRRRARGRPHGVTRLVREAPRLAVNARLAVRALAVANAVS